MLLATLNSYKLKFDYGDERQRYKGLSELHINTTIVDSTGIRDMKEVEKLKDFFRQRNL